MDTSESVPAGAKAAYDALCTVLGVKGPLRLIPQTQSNRPHIVIKRDTTENNESGEIDPNCARFNFVASKRINVNKGAVLLFGIELPTPEGAGKPKATVVDTFLLEGDLLGAGEEEEEVAKVTKKASSDVKRARGQARKNIVALPPKMRKSLGQKIPNMYYAAAHELGPRPALSATAPSSAHTERAYASVAVQTDDPCIRSTPPVVTSPLVASCDTESLRKSPMQLPSPVSAAHAREATPSASLPSLEYETPNHYEHERSLSPMDLESDDSSPDASPAGGHAPLPVDNVAPTPQLVSHAIAESENHSSDALPPPMDEQDPAHQGAISSDSTGAYVLEAPLQSSDEVQVVASTLHQDTTRLVSTQSLSDSQPVPIIEDIAKVPVVDPSIPMEGIMECSSEVEVKREQIQTAETSAMLDNNLRPPNNATAVTEPIQVRVEKDIPSEPRAMRRPASPSWPTGRAPPTFVKSSQASLGSTWDTAPAAPYVQAPTLNNPLGIRPAKPAAFNRPPPTGPRCLVNTTSTASTPSVPKKPVVVGAKWSATRGATQPLATQHSGSSNSSSSGSVPTLSLLQKVSPAAPSTVGPPTAPRADRDLSSVVGYSSPSPPPPEVQGPPLKHDSPPPPGPPTNLTDRPAPISIKWKRIGDSSTGATSPSINPPSPSIPPSLSTSSSLASAPVTTVSSVPSVSSAPAPPTQTVTQRPTIPLPNKPSVIPTNVPHRPATVLAVPASFSPSPSTLAPKLTSIPASSNASTSPSTSATTSTFTSTATNPSAPSSNYTAPSKTFSSHTTVFVPATKLSSSLDASSSWTNGSNTLNTPNSSNPPNPSNLSNASHPSNPSAVPTMSSPPNPLKRPHESSAKAGASPLTDSVPLSPMSMSISPSPERVHPALSSSVPAPPASASAFASLPPKPAPSHSHSHTHSRPPPKNVDSCASSVAGDSVPAPSPAPTSTVADADAGEPKKKKNRRTRRQKPPRKRFVAGDDNTGSAAGAGSVDWPMTAPKLKHRLVRNLNPPPGASGAIPGVKKIMFAEDGMRVAILCEDHTMRIWLNESANVAPGEIARLNHRHSLVTGCWMDWRRILVVVRDGGVMLWTRSMNGKEEWTPARLFTLPPYGPGDAPYSITYAPGRIAISVPTGVKIWLSINGQWQQQRDIVRGGVTAIRFIHDGAVLIGGCRDGAIWSCDVPNGTLRAYVFMEQSKAIQSIDVYPSGQRMLVTQEGGLAHLISLNRSDNRGVVEHTYASDEFRDPSVPLFPGVFAMRGQTVLFGYMKDSVPIWNRQKGGVVYGLRHNKGDVVQAAATFDDASGVGGSMITGTSKGELFWWPPPEVQVHQSTESRSDTPDDVSRKRVRVG